MPQAETNGARTTGAARRRKPWRIRTYIVLLATPLLIAELASTVYEHRVTIDDAEVTARHNASHLATLAAALIDSGIATTRAEVADRATVSAAPLDAGCSATVADAGLAVRGHVDVIDAAGVTRCSSATGTGKTVSSKSPPWLAQVLAGPTLIGPVTDPDTGRLVAIIGVPLADHSGAVVRTVDLLNYGAGLASMLGQGGDFEVVVADGSHVIASSIEPQRWTGAPVAGTGFDRATGPGKWRDLDGTYSIFSPSAIGSTGWTVYVGTDRTEAMALAEQSANRNLVINMAPLLLLLFAVVVAFRQIVNPISRLRGRVREAITSGTSRPLDASGPLEVEELAADFRELVADRERELVEARRLGATNAAILNADVDSIVTIDSDGNIVEFNPVAERTFGYLREQVLGRPMAEVIVPVRLREAHRRGLAHYAATGEGSIIGQRTELIAMRKDGSELPVELTITVVDIPGSPLFTGYLHDLTEQVRTRKELAASEHRLRMMLDNSRKRVEAERRFLQERLEQSQRLESLGQLAGGVAHDFNNLLAVILIHAKFVADQTEGQVRDDVEQIRISAERAAGLTRQLLVFGGRERVNPQLIELKDLIDGVHDELARGIGVQIDLVVDVSAEVPRVLADRGQMEQVLLNLAINAGDAMPDGGTLTFCIDTENDTEGGPDAGPVSRPRVRLTVTDTGEGMPPEVVARAFEPFFTTKPPGQGTGLGLATVYGIVTDAGGTIELTSTPGEGTTVRIMLQAAETAMLADADQVADAAPAGGGETILVVDDEPALLAATVRMLEDHGYDVISAGSADEALARSQGEDIQLLLTDFVMPKMSGSQLADRMRQQCPGLPVLLMSGYSHGLSNYEPLGDNPLRVLRKPFSQRELLIVVHEALSME